MDYSIGVVELRNISKGLQATDEALKTSSVRLVTAQPICPGKFELIITGNIAQVGTAMERLQSLFAEHVVDATHMGRIDPQVMHALLGAQPTGARGALGTVETFTVASAILAADTAVKSAQVEIVELRTARGIGGKGLLLLTGEVSDVEAAVKSGEKYAKEQGLFVSSTVIAAPHDDLWNFI